MKPPTSERDAKPPSERRSAGEVAHHGAGDSEQSDVMKAKMTPERVVVSLAVMLVSRFK